MVLNHHGNRHDAYAFILEELMPFSGVSCRRAATFTHVRDFMIFLISCKNKEGAREVTRVSPL